MEKYMPKTDRDKISYAKKLDASMMPLCERVLVNKIRRVKFLAKMWMSTIEASPSNYSLLDFGWKFVNRDYQLLWFEGGLSPSVTSGKYCMLLLLFFDRLFLLHF